MDLGAEKIIHDVKKADAHRVSDIFDFDPTKRSSGAWFLGEWSLVLLHLGMGQYFVQRYVSCATLNDARKSVWVGTIVSLIVGGLLIPLIGTGTSVTKFSKIISKNKVYLYLWQEWPRFPTTLVAIQC